MKNEGMPKIYTKNVEVTPLQERLLSFFDFDETGDSQGRLESYEWLFEAVLYHYESNLTHKDRSCLCDLSELIKILKGIQQGY